MAARPRNGAFLALLACAFIGAACSNIETPDFDADAARIVPRDWQPIGLHVGVAPMRAALEVTPGEFNKEGTRRWVLPTDEAYMNAMADGFTARLIAALTKYRMFERVQVIQGVTNQTTEAEMRRLALTQHFDVVMVPTVRLNDVRYVGSNAAYGWNMFVWWMVSPILSWYIADEDFEYNLVLDLRFSPVSHDRQIFQRRLPPLPPTGNPQGVIRSLDDFDQGFHLFSIYSTPGYMGEDNWKHIGEKLRPIAENEIKKHLLTTVIKDLAPESRKPEFRSAVRRRVALVVGADGQNNVPPHFAIRDADVMHTHLEFARAHSVHSDAMRRLSGIRATRGNIDTAARELAQLARSNDDVLLYFSGAGTVDENGRPAIVTEQAGDQAAGYVVLEDLVAKLITGKPRSITLILDCSFATLNDRRCVLSELQHKQLLSANKGSSLLDPVRERIEKEGVHCVILAASDAVPGNPHGMKALEIEELSHGLFTAFALDALGGRADTNGDGQVTFEEFQTFVQVNVTRVAKLERETQTGYFYISEAFKNEFALPTGRQD